MRPIFIVGAGHSGTTILYKMLAGHPDLAWFSQYSCRGGEIPGRFPLPFYKYFNLILRWIFVHNWSKKGKKIRIVPYPSDAEQIWEYIIPRDGSDPREEIVSRIRKILTAECNYWRKDFVLLKNIRFYRYLPLLRFAFPQAKFIHIVRDGRAKALSRTHTIQKAKDWVKILEEINREKEGLDFFELRYEDFCSDVRGHLRKILNYAGLDEKKFPFDKLPLTLASMNKKWFERAGRDEMLQIENIQKEMLKKYGYI